MASVQEVISSSDVEKIKQRRTACKRMLTVLKTGLELKLVKLGDDFDHTKIVRSKVHDDVAKVKKYYQDFEDLHVAHLSCLPELDDVDDENKQLEKEEKYYTEVCSVAQNLLELVEKYEASYTLHQSSLSAPAKEKVENESKNIAAQLVQQNVLTAERALKKSLLAFTTDKEDAQGLVKKVEGLEYAAMLESDQIRGLPVLEVKESLIKSFGAVSNAADNYLSALEAQLGFDGAEEKLVAKFDQSKEYGVVSQLKLRLHLMHSAITERSLAVAPTVAATITPHPITPLPGVSAPPRAAPIKIKLPAISFSGLPRDFANFKKEFEEIVVPGRPASEVGALLRDAIPEKHKHLVRNLDLSNHAGAMNILQEEFGKPEHIMNWVVNELSKLKLVTSDKLFVDFVEKLEKISRDLEAVGMKKDLMNARMIADIVAKLPPVIAHKWAEYKVMNKVGDKSSEDHFSELFSFLQEYKKITKNINPEFQSNQTVAATKFCFVTGQTYVASSSPAQQQDKKSCLVCADVKNPRESQHWTSTCEKWKSMNIQERKKVAKCWKHPFDDHSYSNCSGAKMRRYENSGKVGFKCAVCNLDNHCAELCSQNRAITKVTKSTTVLASGPLPPVLLQTSVIKTVNGNKVGALWDLCSTDNYITFSKAAELRLQGEDIMLTVEGIAGVEETTATKLFAVPLFTRKGKKRVYMCYGLDTIASVADPPDDQSYKDMCSKFSVSVGEVERPKQIDILISMRHNKDHPKSVSSKGDMTLWEGVFGKLFGGVDDSLKFQPHVLSCHIRSRQRGCIYSSTLRAVVKAATHVNSAKGDKDLLQFFEEEAIGVDAKPKCGACACGQCMLKDQPMSLRMEKDYAEFKKNLLYLPEGLPNDPGPFFQTSYKWDIPRENLVPNYAAVKATFHRTKKRLLRDPEFEDIYDKQLIELINMGVARELGEAELDNWISAGNPYYYISHQMVVNEENKTTPIRVVFNSSQKFAGQSLNSSWSLGPDLIANLQGVLLRFRSDVVGAQGDIRKMFYMIRVSKNEEMMQLWIWKFKGENKIRTFAMTRLVMGNKPSSNISVLAVRECTNLLNYKKRYPDACQTLLRDTYVDNVFVTGESIESLFERISEIEEVTAAGGFLFKPWMVSGQVSGEESIVQVGCSEVEKALGMYWNTQSDVFFVKLEISTEEKLILNGCISTVGSRSSSHSGGKISLPQTVAPKLTLRIALSFHSRIFDPLGLVLPTKMVGMLLFRDSIQTLKKGLKGRIPWDEHLEGELLSQWGMYFQMLIKLESITFSRSFKPENVDVSVCPDLVTFSDGNPHAFGTVAYVVWTLTNGYREACLIGSKAKLAQILKKSETVRNELNGATFSARFKSWIYKQSGIKFAKHYPIVDSRIVQDMIKKDSYSLDTFTGLRVSEIQKKTDVDAWLHVASKENISDILTKGASPDSIGPGSLWQLGPSWLIEQPSQWPVTDVKYDPVSTESLLPFLAPVKKSRVFSSQALSSKVLDLSELLNISSQSLDNLFTKFSSLPKLIRIVAYILRCALSTRKVGGTSREGRTHVFCMRVLDISKFISEHVPEVSAGEYHDAWMVLIYLEQRLRLKVADIKKLVPVKVTIKLSSYSWSVEHVILGGRVSSFPVGFKVNEQIPIIPYGPLARLVISYYHNKYHRDIDTVVSFARHDVWVIRARKLAAEIDRICRICLEKRKIVASQVMGQAPDFKSIIQPAWSSVNMDLFGPILIKDECVKKGPRVRKKVYGVLYTCTLTRGVHLDVATGYDTEAILHTVRRLLAAKGDVKLIISDPGSQLRGASKEIAGWRKGWDQRLLVRFGAEKSLDWRFIMAGSQHQNGAAEALIKMVKGVKNSMMKALGTQVLTLNELNTLMAEVAQLINERPIGLKPNERTHPHFLSPNSLYLGRCSDRIASGPFQSDEVFLDDPRKASSRFLLVQAITSQFWRMWLRDYFPSLLIRQKWHVQRRNVRVNDVCLLRDQDVLRGEWRLARVVEVYPDRFGNVRNVEVLVKSIQDGSILYKPGAGQRLRRHVNNLLVLVPAEEQADQVSLDTVTQDGELPHEEDGCLEFMRSSGGTVSLA